MKYYQEKSLSIVNVLRRIIIVLEVGNSDRRLFYFGLYLNLLIILLGFRLRTQLLDVLAYLFAAFFI